MREARNRDRLLLFVSFCLFVTTIAVIGLLLFSSPIPFEPLWFFWSVLIAAIELLPVPAWRGLTISVGFPVLVTVAIYNRRQVALSVVAASAMFPAFHPASSPLHESAAWILVVAAALAALADYAVNAGLVTVYMSTKLGIPAREMFRQLTIGNVRDFLISYLGLGILGLTLAVFVQVVGAPYAVPAFLAPLIFARQMFFRSQALEEAHVELI